MLRSTFSGGPAYATHDSLTYQFREDWEAAHEIITIDEMTNLQGKVGEREDFSRSLIRATPIAFTSTLASVLAKLFKFGGKVGIVEGQGVGKKLFPSTDLPLVIQTSNGGTSDLGQSITFSAAALQQPPELTFGANLPLFGQAEWLALRKDNTAATDAAAHVAVADSTFTEPSFSPTNINNTTYTLAWGSSGSPFTGIECDENGVKVKVTYAWQERKTWTDGLIQLQLSDVQVEASFTPINFDAANFHNTFLLQDGASAGRGKLLSSRGAQLTITGATAGDPLLILPSCVPITGPTRFGANSRVGEVTLRAQYGASSTLSITTTNTSTDVTTASTATLRAGMSISGTGIPAAATIVSITNATTFVISAAATASGTVTGTFTGRHPLYSLQVVA